MAGAVTTLNLAHQIHLHLQGLPSESCCRLMPESYQHLSVDLFSALDFSRDKQENVTLGAHHQMHWLESDTICTAATCRGMGKDWHQAATLSGGPVTDSRLQSIVAPDGPPHSKMGQHLPAIKK